MKDLKAGKYKISKFCMEPTAFKVKEESQFANKEPEFVKTKLMTRLTYTLDEVSLCTACQPASAVSVTVLPTAGYTDESERYCRCR